MKNFLHEYESEGANDSDESSSSNMMVNVQVKDEGVFLKTMDKNDENNDMGNFLPLNNISQPLNSCSEELKDHKDKQSTTVLANNLILMEEQTKTTGSVEFVSDKLDAPNKSNNQKHRNYRSHTNKAAGLSKTSKSTKMESKSHRESSSHVSSHLQKSRHRSRSRSHGKRRREDSKEKSIKRSRNSSKKADKRGDERERRHHHRSHSRDHKSSSHSSRKEASTHTRRTSHHKSNNSDKSSAKPVPPIKSDDPMESIDFQMDTVRKAMEYAVEKASETSGITLPKYYNPATVNPMKYAERMQKRKLLWTGANKKKSVEPESGNGPGIENLKVSKEETVNACTKSDDDVQIPTREGLKGQAAPPTTLNATELYWQKTAFAESEQTEKFRKLMGIKKVKDSSAASSTESAPTLTEDEKRKRQEYFEKLDRQYEIARMSTHTMRGVGLGYASNSLFDSNFLGKM